MGSLKFLKKIGDKLDEYIENRELRSRRASLTQPPPHSWGPDPFEEERNRRKSHDERFRRHTDTDLNERRIKMAATEKRSLKMSNNELPNRKRVSEGNLPSPRKSRDVVARSGDEGQERSPRKSDGELVCRRREDQRALRESGRPRASNDHVNRPHKDIPPVPPIPPHLTAEYRRNISLSPRDQKKSGLQNKHSNKNSLAETRHRCQDESRQKKAQVHPRVDWDALIGAKNEQVKLAAIAKKRDEQEKRRAAEQKWKAAEQRRRAEEEYTASDNRRFETERQRAREKVDKRSDPDEAEKKANAARVQRENEERRLRTFGPPGVSMQPARRPTCPSAPATGESNPQREPLEKRESKPNHLAAAVTNAQEQMIRRPRPLERRKSVPARPQHGIVQKVPPTLAPLTQENLRTKAAIEDEDDDRDPLGRGLGDNMRTFIQGFALPTIYHSDITPSTSEKDETKDRNKNMMRPIK